MILLTDFDQQLQGLSTGSPPPPSPPPPTTSLADFFFSLSSPNREPRIYYANRTTAGEVLLVRHYSAVNSPG